jgi:cytochrome P450
MKIPPGSKGLPIIGNLEAFEQDRLSFLRDCGEKYGDIVRYNKNIYILYHPSLLEKIFTRTNKEFSVGFDVFQHQVDKSYTEGFMAYRKVITSGLKHSQIRNFIPEISRITSVVMREWEYGKQFDVPKTMETITGNVIANYCFGEDSEGISELATKLLDSLVVIIGNPFLFPEWLPTPTNIRIKRNTRKLQKAILQIIEKRRNVSYLGDDLLGTLLKAKWSENQGTDEQLSRALIGTLLAAHRVPASALSWLLFLITSHPEVESQIQQEMNEIIGDRLLQGKDIAKLTYLTSTVKEALRLYPPTWLSTLLLG